MAAGKSSRINRQYKTKYRIRNWREYERGLRSREAFQDALADAGYVDRFDEGVSDYDAVGDAAYSDTGQGGK